MPFVHPSYMPAVKLHRLHWGRTAFLMFSLSGQRIICKAVHFLYNIHMSGMSVWLISFLRRTRHWFIWQGVAIMAAKSYECNVPWQGRGKVSVSQSRWNPSCISPRPCLLWIILCCNCVQYLPGIVELFGWESSFFHATPGMEIMNNVVDRHLPT